VFDKVVARLRRDAREFEMDGYNCASVDIFDDSAPHEKQDFEIGVMPH